MSTYSFLHCSLTQKLLKIPTLKKTLKQLNLKFPCSQWDMLIHIYIFGSSGPKRATAGSSLPVHIEVFSNPTNHLGNPSSQLNKMLQIIGSAQSRQPPSCEHICYQRAPKLFETLKISREFPSLWKQWRALYVLTRTYTISCFFLPPQNVFKIVLRA